MARIPPLPFYSEWKGHTIEHLSNLHKIILSLRAERPIIYLAGDSSLDNKAWVPSAGLGGEPLPVAVPELYDHVLQKPTPKPDIAFWLNHFTDKRASIINTAVEASLLRERNSTLLPHDEFIRDHIRPQDILVVSVGANDIALYPTASTAFHILRLAWLTSKRSLDNGTAWSLSHFRHMFGAQTQDYILRIVEKTKPSLVIICTIYFPLESGLSTQRSWADAQLSALGYNRNPSCLQAAIRAMFDSATKGIQIPGTKVVPVALFDVMDGKNVGDYVERVEPSVEGGRKMGLMLSDVIMSCMVADQAAQDSGEIV